VLGRILDKTISFLFSGYKPSERIKPFLVGFALWAVVCLVWVYASSYIMAWCTVPRVGYASRHPAASEDWYGAATKDQAKDIEYVAFNPGPCTIAKIELRVLIPDAGTRGEDDPAERPVGVQAQQVGAVQWSWHKQSESEWLCIVTPAVADSRGCIAPEHRFGVGLTAQIPKGTKWHPAVWAVLEGGQEIPCQRGELQDTPAAWWISKVFCRFGVPALLLPVVLVAVILTRKYVAHRDRWNEFLTFEQTINAIEETKPSAKQLGEFLRSWRNRQKG